MTSILRMNYGNQKSHIPRNPVNFNRRLLCIRVRGSGDPFKYLTNSRITCKLQHIMAEEEDQQKQADPPSQPPPAAASSQLSDSSPSFDPSRMIGIIKRKALIKELAALYHAECLAYCQELLELQKKWEEPFMDAKIPGDSRKETTRPPKRMKKTR